MAWLCVALLLVIAALKSPHHPAALIANIPIPMLFYSWVGMAIGLVPVVAIETFAVWIGLRGSWTDVLMAVAVSNVVSTIAGVPITNVALIFVQEAKGIRPGFNPHNRFMLSPWRVAGLVIGDGTPPSVRSSAFVSLLPPFFIGSCLIEAPLVIFILERTDWIRVSIAVVLANVGSYLFLAAYTVLARRSSYKTDYREEIRDLKNAVPQGLGLSSMTLSPDESVIAAGFAGYVMLWDRESGRYLNQLKGHQDHVRFLAFSPGGRYLACNAWKTHIYVWDWKNAERVKTLESGFHISSLSFSNDGRYLCASFFEDNVWVWRTDTWTVVPNLEGSLDSASRTLTLTGAQAYTARFSPDSLHLAAAYDRSNPEDCSNVCIWSLETFKIVRKITAEGEKEFLQCAFHPHEPLLSAVSTVFREDGSDSIHIWNYENGRLVSTIPLDGFDPMSIAFTPDGTCLALGCNDGFVRFWDIASGMLTRTIDTDVHSVSKSMRFHFPDQGKWFVLIQEPEGKLLVKPLEDALVKSP